MADGVELTPSSQSQDYSSTGENESLQGLQPLPAPGVSQSAVQNVAASQSKRGIFRVFAGLSPATSTITSPHMCYSDAGDNSTSYTHDIGVRANTSVSASATPLISNSDSRLLGNNTGLSYESGFKMAGFPNDNLFGFLIEQYKETKAQCNQQQASLDKLTKAVQSLANKVGKDDNDYDKGSDLSDEEDCQLETISSDEEMVGHNQMQLGKRKTSDEPELETCNKKLKRLKDVEAQFTKKEDLSSDVHEVVASTVNKGLSEKIDHQSAIVQELLKKYNRPGNCEYLEVPKVNKLLWTNKQTSKDLKQTDKGFQRTQNYLTKGMIPLIQIMNKTLIMESEDAEELFDWSLDAFNLLAHAHRDFSVQRRRSLLPAISSRYAALCRDSEKILSPTHLFGEDKDLEKRLREIDESQKLSKSLTVLTPGKTRLYKQSTWGSRDTTGRNMPSTSKDFLGKRALTHFSQQKPKYKKGDQGQKKFQRSQKH